MTQEGVTCSQSVHHRIFFHYFFRFFFLPGIYIIFYFFEFVRLSIPVYIHFSSVCLLNWRKKSVYGYSTSSSAPCVASLAPSSAFWLPSIIECPGINIAHLVFLFVQDQKCCV